MRGIFSSYVRCQLIAFFAVIAFLESSAQTIPVGTNALEDYYRRAQLMGQIDSSVSFTIRPLNPFRALGKMDMFYPDSTKKRSNFFDIPGHFTDSASRIRFALLPLNLQMQTNTDFPYGWNDGIMIPAKGLQTVVSAGVFAEWGPISLQLRPEMIEAVNSDFETFDEDHYDVIFARYYDYYNRIDLPARFGNRTYSKIFWGQSSLRANYKGFSAGLSTENIWWGPGMGNSLVMSNNAPGFAHITFNTTKPQKTPIGSFEGQLIMGRLNGSGFGVLEPEKNYLDGPLDLPKSNDWRLLSGMVLTWNPKWVPGLFLGFSRSSQLYSENISGIGNYLPFFSTRRRADADPTLADRDIRSSVFFRWVWPEEQAELYGEFGRENTLSSARQAVLQADRSRAYVVGLRKIVNLPGVKQHKLLVNVEVAQLQQTNESDLFKLKSWYINSTIRHGYTHRGQVLGAGIGPGGNSQTVEISWLSGLKRIGLQLERYVHNNDFYYYAYIDNKDMRRHWTDLSVGLSGEWNYKSFIFNAKWQRIYTLNNQWYISPYDLNDPTVYWTKSKRVVNVHGQVGIQYVF